MRNEINRGMNFRYFQKNIKNSENKGSNFRYCPKKHEISRFYLK
ncbi:hypothetical protein [Solibacillus sp. FSL K6-4121]